MNAEIAAENLRSYLEGDTIAIVGGAEWKEEGHTEPLRESDKSGPESETIELEEIMEANYGVSGNELIEAVGDRNVYISGGIIANPFARLVNGNIQPEEVNSVDFGTLVSERRYPFTFDDEGIAGREILSENFPEDSESTEWYGMTAEEFRKNARPNYVVDRSYGDDGADVLNEFESIWVPENGNITELEGETQKGEYLSRRFAPMANGNGWQTDYAILGVHENPFGDGNVVSAMGAHNLGTTGANDVITYPDSDIEDTDAVLEALGQFQKETDADEYQALIQIYSNPNTSETRNNLVAVGEL